MSQVTTFDFMRHGAVDGPAALYGQTDIPLSELGRRAMFQQLELLALPDAVVSSPRIRCREVAESYALQHQLPFQILDEIKESDFGAWDGVSFDNPELNFAQLEAFWQNPTENTPPGGESLQQAFERVGRGWSHLQQHYRGQRTLVVAHGGVIRMILAQILTVDWQGGNWFSALQIAHASITRITIGSHPESTPCVAFIGARGSLELVN